MSVATELVKGAFGGLLQGINDLITTDEERANVQVLALSVQAEVIGSVLEFEKAAIEAQQKVIVAEAQGASWLQRNWRPLVMIMFASVVAWNYILAPLGGWISLQNGGYEWPQLDMPEGLWVLLQLGIGGYVASRGAEKVATTLAASGGVTEIGLGPRKREMRKRIRELEKDNEALRKTMETSA